MRFLNELHEGDRVNGIYLCKQKQAATTKNGKPYENLILQDKTGVIDGKIWDPNSLGIDDFDALDYIEIMGDVTSFAGAMQLNIKRAARQEKGSMIRQIIFRSVRTVWTICRASCENLSIACRIHIFPSF